jgi:hypothetical protein
MQIGKYRLEGGGACPEQYYVFDGEDQVAYMRLRNGFFYATVNGESAVFKAHPKGDGMFEGDERERYLEAAVRAIDENLNPDKIDRKNSEIKEILAAGNELIAAWANWLDVDYGDCDFDEFFPTAERATTRYENAKKEWERINEKYAENA